MHPGYLAEQNIMLRMLHTTVLMHPGYLFEQSMMLRMLHTTANASWLPS